MLRKSVFAALPAALLLAGLSSAQAAVGYAGGTYAESFDSLATTGTANVWANDSTISGWSLFTKDSNAITAYRADNGASNAGSFYSYGATGSTERALGGLGSAGAYFGAPVSGAIAGWMAVAVTNTSGAAFDAVNIAFDGEQWRKGGVTSGTVGSFPQTMVLEYGFGNTFGAVTTWNAPGGSFDWASPQFGELTAAAVDGNGVGLMSARGGTLHTSWNAGDTLWVRWTERNDPNNDHGLAIDNFSLTASVTAVPEPETYAMLLAGLGLVGLMARRRKQGSV